MKVLLSLAVLLTTNCGMKEQDLVNPAKKLGKDINQEAIRGHRRVANAYVKAERDTTNEAGRFSDSTKGAAADANRQALDNTSKANDDFLSEKDKLTERLVGSNDKQIESNTAAIADLKEELQVSVEDLELMLRSEIEDADEELLEELQQLASDTQSDLADLEQSISDVADTIEEDTTCSVTKVRRQYRKRITITCGSQRVRFWVY